MNWKFWQIGAANEQIDGLRRNIDELTGQVRTSPVVLYDPAWGEKQRALLDRLSNTPENDPLMNGMLAMIDQAMLLQVQRCEQKGLPEIEAVQICAALGTLVGLRADLKHRWQGQLAKRVEGEHRARMTNAK